LLAGAALRPVDRMAAEADEISVGRLDRRLDVPGGNDEIAHLSRTLNAMLDRIERSVEHERRFLDDASHELRTPLTILRGELELALARPDDREELVAALRSSLEEAERLSRLSDDLLVLARARTGEARARDSSFDVLEEARRVCDLFGHDDIAVSCDGQPVTITGDRDRIDQVLINLIDNAQRFARGRVTVSVGAVSGGAEVTVADDGPGFDPAILPVTFERFTRADPARTRDTGGTGLGLAIVAELVRSRGGEVDAANGPPLGGACVRVRLPGVPVSEPRRQDLHSPP
jgi:signal transduction histidine kinase